MTDWKCSICGVPYHEQTRSRNPYWDKCIPCAEALGEEVDLFKGLMSDEWYEARGRDRFDKNKPYAGPYRKINA